MVGNVPLKHLGQPSRNKRSKSKFQNLVVGIYIDGHFEKARCEGESTSGFFTSAHTV